MLFFFSFFFFPKPTTWCIQFQTVLELSKSHPESTRYSSLVLEECAAIMNIMTVFVYRAGRQDIKVSLLMTNIKEMSVSRDGEIMSIEGSNPIFSMCVIAEMILFPCWRSDCERPQQEMAHKGLIQSSGKSLDSLSSQTCSRTVFEKTDKWRKALLRHTKAQTCLSVDGLWSLPANSNAVGCYWELGTAIVMYLSIDSKPKNSEIVLELFFLPQGTNKWAIGLVTAFIKM